jgi:hypothetical protein
VTTDEIRKQLGELFRERTTPLRAPTANEWEALRSTLGWTWPDDFFAFHSVVGRCWFEGDLLGVAAIDDPDTIAVTRDAEVSIGGWPEDLIPFLAVGNGDYFCLSLREAAASRVYYIRHEDRGVERLHDSFAGWIQDLGAYYQK